MRLLEGIKVVEFATFVAVPIMTRVLADWGAEVIKVEAAVGDEWRKQGGGNNLPIEDNCNPEFSMVNGGKRFISLNLKKPEGKEALLKLLADADIFVSNIRWESIVRLGLDYDTLHAMFPKLIYFHFTGFGYDGPGKARPGFDSSAFWASSGLLYEFPEKGSHPLTAAAGFGDTVSASGALSGVMGALYHRAMTGNGIRVTTSLYANAIWCNFSRITACQERKDGRIVPVYPRTHHEANHPFINIYQCKDERWILLGAYYSTRFEAIMQVLGLEEYITDERFNTEEKMYRNKSALRDLFAEAFKTKTVAEWSELLLAYDIAHQKLVNSSEVSKDEQAWANDYLTNVQFPNGEEYILPNSPVTFYGLERLPAPHAGGIGCNTTEILTEYGYIPERIQQLKDCGAAAGI